MLSPPDGDLARRDPALASLGALLDPEAFAARLRPFFPGVELGEGRITCLRYKPGTSCLAAYAFDSGGGPAARIYARVHGPDAASMLDKARMGKTAISPLGPGWIVLEDLSMVVSVFPNDGRIRALIDLAEPGARREALRKVLPHQPGAWEGQVETLAYRPERRYVAGLRAGGGTCAVVKLYSRSGYVRALGNAKRFRRTGTSRLPRLIGKWDRGRILAFEWLSGRLLEELICPSPAEIALFTADGLFGLSAHPFRLHEPGWPGQIEAILARAAEILEDAFAGGPPPLGKPGTRDPARW